MIRKLFLSPWFLLCLTAAALANAPLPTLRDYAVLPPPAPGDWLAGHEVNEQSLEDFQSSDHLVITSRRNVIRIVPLGDPPLSELTVLRRYVETYYPGSRVEVAPPQSLGDDIRVRHGKLSSDDLLDYLDDEPDNIFLNLGVTSEDIYEETVPCCHPLFGEAPYAERRALASVARLGTPGTEQFRARLLKLGTHEINHAIGIRHCKTYRCIMNGSSHLAEADARPPYLCPEDLSKLEVSLQCDIISRYRDLLEFHRGDGLSVAADWYADRLLGLRKHLNG